MSLDKQPRRARCAVPRPARQVLRAQHSARSSTGPIRRDLELVFAELRRSKKGRGVEELRPSVSQVRSTTPGFSGWRPLWTRNSVGSHGDIDGRADRASAGIRAGPDRGTPGEGRGGTSRLHHERGVAAHPRGTTPEDQGDPPRVQSGGHEEARAKPRGRAPGLPRRGGRISKLSGLDGGVARDRPRPRCVRADEGAGGCRPDDCRSDARAEH